MTHWVHLLPRQNPLSSQSTGLVQFSITCCFWFPPHKSRCPQNKALFLRELRGAEGEARGAARGLHRCTSLPDHVMEITVSK